MFNLHPHQLLLQIQKWNMQWLERITGCIYVWLLSKALYCFPDTHTHAQMASYKVLARPLGAIGGRLYLVCKLKHILAWGHSVSINVTDKERKEEEKERRKKEAEGAKDDTGIGSPKETGSNWNEFLTKATTLMTFWIQDWSNDIEKPRGRAAL